MKEKIEIEKHLGLLGMKVEDKVTKMKGVVTSICFDLYGCIQATINPGMDKEGKLKECFWFDVQRLNILEKNPVMERPNFDYGKIAEGKKGPAEKPAFNKV